MCDIAELETHLLPPLRGQQNVSLSIAALIGLADKRERYCMFGAQGLRIVVLMVEMQVR
jgi:hypothetical protein